MCCLQLGANKSYFIEGTHLIQIILLRFIAYSVELGKICKKKNGIGY